VEIDIKGFIGQLQKGDLPGAYKILRDYNSLPAVCGRVCPQETQCEGMCIMGKNPDKTGGPVAIGRLERYVADTFAARLAEGDTACLQITGEAACRMERPDVKVACIGGGPSSLTVAGYLAALGIKVTVFEALHEVGGVLVYGIPEFRLPKAIVRREIDAMKALGVEFKTNWVGGKAILVQELLDQGYKAVFLGVGAGLPQFMKIPGENSIGVFSANEYLTRSNLMKAYEKGRAATPLYPSRRVAVLGGGNVAMDSARMALRLGAEEVRVLYRRTREEMPARAEEVVHAMEEGIIFDFLRSPTRVLGDGTGRVVGLEVLAYELGEADDSGRRRPVAVRGSETVVPFDTVIVAVGNESNPLISRTTPELKVDRWGHILVDETQKTSMERVYAGGDIVLGAAIVILAMGEGRRAAAAINEVLQ